VKNVLRNKFEIIKPHIVPVLFLSGVTFALYWQALGHNFLIYWDDNGYVTKNLTIQRLTWENIKTAFTSFYIGNYAPLQIVSYMVDYFFWGMRPEGFIFTNMLIHTANGLLFYYLLSRLSWQRLPACAAALIFLIHPVQVESVVWISQRKTVLAMLFFLLSFIWYIRYREEPGRRRGIWYVSSMAAFILALLTKSVAIVLPLFFAAYDFLKAPERDRKDLKKMLVDTIPFIVVACFFVFLTIRSQSADGRGGLTSYINGSPVDTLFTMLPVFTQYLKLVVWPANLSAVYAPAIKTGFDLEVVLAVLVLSIIAALGIFLYHRRRDLLFWIVLFFLGLLPVSQIIPLVTLMNDRYLYFPMLGAAACIASIAFLALNETRKNKHLARIAVGVPFLLLLAHFAVASYVRIPVWKDEKTLWEDAVRKVPDSPRAHFSYAHILELQGMTTEAENQYQLGLNASPEPFERYSLARLHEKNGRPDKARAEYQIVLSQSPLFQDARNNLALLYVNEGMLAQAIEQYQIGLKYNPGWAAGYNNLSILYARSGNKDAALENFRKAVSLNPYDAEVHYNFGNMLLQKGSKEEALREFETAARLDPGRPLYAAKLAEVSERLKGRTQKKGK
jgi:tetratricopeptide (TPR) repeat protein